MLSEAPCWKFSGALVSFNPSKFRLNPDLNIFIASESFDDFVGVGVEVDAQPDASMATAKNKEVIFLLFIYFARDTPSFRSGRDSA